MLTQTKKDFTVYARMLDKPYESYKLDDLATAYCLAVDANDEVNKNIYMSALILRFWYLINKMYVANPSLGYSHADFLDVVVDGIYKACEPRYRGWMNPDKKVNASQCLNMCITTKLRERYYFANLDKHRANQNTMSLETPLGGSESEDGTTLADILEADEQPMYGDDSLYIVQEYVDKNKIIEAIILDSIAYQETYRKNKKVVKTVDEFGNVEKHTEYSTEFWPYKLVQFVSQLPEDYDKYFSKKYSVAPVKLDVALETIRKANKQKLYKYLSRTLEDARAHLA